MSDHAKLKDRLRGEAPGPTMIDCRAAADAIEALEVRVEVAEARAAAYRGVLEGACYAQIDAIRDAEHGKAIGEMACSRTLQIISERDAAEALASRQAQDIVTLGQLAGRAAELEARIAAAVEDALKAQRAVAIRAVREAIAGVFPTGPKSWSDYVVRELSEALDENTTAPPAADEIERQRARIAALEAAAPVENCDDCSPEAREARMPDNDKVICPNCVHQFTALPVSAQARIAALESENFRLAAIACETPMVTEYGNKGCAALDDAQARIATLEKALHEARLYSQDGERAVLERAIARMGWPEIKAFRDQLALGQDIYEDAGGFIMRAIRCLFGLPAPDLIVTHQDAALAMVATALAKKET